jgi:hypothetical protein
MELLKIVPQRINTNQTLNINAPAKSGERGLPLTVMYPPADTKLPAQTSSLFIAGSRFVTSGSRIFIAGSLFCGASSKPSAPQLTELVTKTNPRLANGLPGKKNPRLDTQKKQAEFDSVALWPALFMRSAV